MFAIEIRRNLYMYELLKLSGLILYTKVFRKWNLNSLKKFVTFIIDAALWKFS